MRSTLFIQPIHHMYTIGWGPGVSLHLPILLDTPFSLIILASCEWRVLLVYSTHLSQVHWEYSCSLNPSMIHTCTIGSGASIFAQSILYKYNYPHTHRMESYPCNHTHLVFAHTCYLYCEMIHPNTHSLYLDKTM